jgi:hypothetical protein
MNPFADVADLYLLASRTSIRITLENTSNLPVDFVKLSFQDSTTARSQAIISEGELSAGEAYELEADLIHRPVFRWEQPDDALTIPAGGRKTINIWCRGKVGWSVRELSRRSSHPSRD